MSKRRLFTLYAAIIFLMVWGFSLINMLKYNEPFKLSELFNVFTFSQAIYAGATFWLTGIVFHRFFPSKKYLLLLAGMIGLIVSFCLIRYTLEEIIAPLVVNTRNYPENVSPWFYFLDNVYYSLVYIALGIGIFLFDLQAGNQKKQAQLLQQNREAELQFLRSQINPHFLFNTLNNIYSLVYEQSPKAPAAMLQLSELMRYILYEKKETVAVNREWDYIKSFITLQQLRFDFPLPINITTTGEPGSHSIPPYLLIPFIENAFKHGDFKDASVPLTIHLTIKNDCLIFETSNKIGTQLKDKTGGIGLDNVRRRLSLLYPDQYELKTTTEGSIFRAYLQLKF